MQGDFVKRRWLGTALVAGALAVAPAVPAAIHKCVDAQGKVTFSDRSCPSAPAAPGAAAEAAEPQAGDPAQGFPRSQPASPAEEVVDSPGSLSEAANPASAAASATPPEAPVEAPFLRPNPRVVPGYRLLLAVGIIAALVGNLMMMVASSKKTWLWPVGMLLFGPIPQVAYFALNVKQTRAAFGAIVAGCVLFWVGLVAPVDLLRVASGYTTLDEGYAASSDDRSAFSLDDNVHVKTEFTWSDRMAVIQPYYVEWVWKTDGEVVNVVDNVLEFTGAPYVINGWMPARDLGAGSHRVEVYLDGELMNAMSFRIKS